MKVPIRLRRRGRSCQSLLQQSGGGICIEPENDVQFLNAVEALAAYPTRRRQLGEAGHQFVAKHFDRDHLAEDYLRVMERTIAGCKE